MAGEHEASGQLLNELSEFENLGLDEGPIEDDVPDDDLLSEMSDELGASDKRPEPVASAQPDLDEEEEEEVEDEDEGVEEEEKGEEGEPEEAPKESRANKRIQSLVAERNAMQEQMAQQQALFQQQMQQQMQYQQQLYQQQMAEQQKQAEILQRQLDLLQNKAEEEAEANLSPMERYKKELLKEAQKLAENQISPQLQELRQQLEAERQQRESMIQQQQSRARLDHFTQQVNQAGQEILFAGMEPEVAKEMASTMEDMMLSYIAATNSDPRTAAMQVKKLMDRYSGARNKAVSKTAGARVRKGKTTVPSPTGKKGASARPKTTLGDEEEIPPGWNYVDWALAGRPNKPK